MLQATNSFSGISVNDLQAAKSFYIVSLGLNLIDESMGLRMELPGGGELFIYEKPNHVPAEFTVLNFVVEDINAAVDELIGAGISVEHYDNLPGQQDDKEILRGKAANQGPDIAWFKDPSGNILAIIEP